jgi:hypothetical protein
MRLRWALMTSSMSPPWTTIQRSMSDQESGVPAASDPEGREHRLDGRPQGARPHSPGRVRAQAARPKPRGECACRDFPRGYLRLRFSIPLIGSAKDRSTISPRPFGVARAYHRVHNRAGSMWVESGQRRISLSRTSLGRISPDHDRRPRAPSDPNREVAHSFDLQRRRRQCASMNDRFGIWVRRSQSGITPLSRRSGLVSEYFDRRR